MPQTEQQVRRLLMRLTLSESATVLVIVRKIRAGGRISPLQIPTPGPRDQARDSLKDHGTTWSSKTNLPSKASRSRLQLQEQSHEQAVSQPQRLRGEYQQSPSLILKNVPFDRQSPSTNRTNESTYSCRDAPKTRCASSGCVRRPANCAMNTT